MKMLKSMMAFVILLFAINAGFSQQTGETKPAKVSRKNADKGKPEAVKEMQHEGGIPQGKPGSVEEKKAEKDALKKNRKSRKGGVKKGHAHSKNKVKGEHARGAEPSKGERKGNVGHEKRKGEKALESVQPEKQEAGKAAKKQRSRNGL